MTRIWRVLCSFSSVTQVKFAYRCKPFLSKKNRKLMERNYDFTELPNIYILQQNLFIYSIKLETDSTLAT